MYLSLLSLPSAHSRALALLADPYKLHQFLQLAFAHHGPELGRVLFRVEPEIRDGLSPVLVQSELRPDWSASTMQTSLPDVEVAVKEISLPIQRNQRLRFRLRANPTLRESQGGKRRALLDEDAQMAWLRRKLEAGGAVLEGASVIQEGKVECRKPRGGPPLVMNSVRFDGVLRVAEPTLFAAMVENGVGSAKGLGFGLLSLAPGQGLLCRMKPRGEPRRL